MNERSNSDWARFVAKTRKRPLIWCPRVFTKDDGTLLRTSWSDRLVPIVVGLGLGIPLTWMAFQDDWTRLLAIIVGPFCLWIAASHLLRTSSLFVRSDSNDVIVRYGFSFFPTRLTLSRQDL